MKSSAIFINAVTDVRTEQGAFHFSLGEMAPGEGGKPEFLPAFRCVLPADDAVNFFSYLRDKADEAKHLAEREIEARKSASTAELDAPSRIGHSPSKALKKRRIAVSGVEPHTK